MTLFLLWHSDQWLSTANRTLIAVCETDDEAKEKLLEYAKTELGIISVDDVKREEPDWDSMTDEEIENYVEPEDNNTYLEDILSDLNQRQQWSGSEDGLYYEEIESGEFIN